MRDIKRDWKLLEEALEALPEARTRPAFIIITGLPGTGKSFFARKLSERLPAVVLESDALRKALFSRPRYTPGESTHLFSICHKLIERLLVMGIPVILDATNLVERHRKHLYHLAETTRAKLILVAVRAPERLVQQRLKQRRVSTTRVDASDADWRIYLKMKDEDEPIPRRHYSVNTSRDIGPVIDSIAREATG